MVLQNLAPPLGANDKNFIPGSSISSLRTPSAKASLISLRTKGWTIAERFESLLRKGTPPQLLETPVRLFSFLPFGHLQMALGLLNLMNAQGGWNRVSSSLNRQIYLNAPLFQRVFQNLIQGLKIPRSTIDRDLPVLTPLSSAPQTAIETGIPESTFLQSVQTNLQKKIDTPEPDTQQRLSKINSKRAQEGKPAVDFLKTTHEIESIMNDPGLSDKQKKDKIGEMRKKLGLSKKDMKKLFTKRLAKLYQEAANQLKTYLNQLKESVKETEKIFGKDSPQALAARERLQAEQNQMEPTLKNWEHQANLYKSMFPSFWSKIGGLFKKIGKGLLKVGKVFTKIMNFVAPFLRFVPGIGQMIAFGWGALKGLYQAFKGNLKGFLGRFLNIAQGIPGIGALLSAASGIASKVIPVAKGLYEAARGNFTGLLQWGGPFLQKIPRVVPFLSKTSEYLSYLISPLRPKSDTYQEGVPPGAVG